MTRRGLGNAGRITDEMIETWKAQRSVYQKIQDGDYDNKLPSASEYDARKVLDALGSRIDFMFNIPPKKSRYLAIVAIMEEVSEQIKILDKEHEKIVAYNTETGRLHVLFEEDLKKEFEVPDKFAGPIFSYAWQQGHAYGYEEVYNHYSELAEMFSETIKYFKELEKKLEEKNAKITDLMMKDK